jgi:scyllo-inositol 2-dehydrogenase (NADP+)
MLNVALIGFGFAGRVFHAPIISAVPGLRLAAILQRTKDDAAGLYPQARIVRSIDELLHMNDIRVVVIATPNASHYPLARQCLLAGKDVVVDKPFTTSYAEAVELVELARQRGRLLTVYQNLRCNGDFRTLRGLVEAGRLGRIVLYESHFDRYRLERRPAAWRENPGPGSGVFFDLGVHLIDQAMLLFGPPEAITAEIRIERQDAVVDDAFDIVLHYDRMRALLRASMIALGPGLRFVVRGERAAFVKYGIDPQEEALKQGQVPHDEHWGREPQEKWGTLYEAGAANPEGQRVPTLPGDYRLFYANLRDTLLGKAPIEVTPEQMLNVMRALELAQESSRRRCTVDWKSR